MSAPASDRWFGAPIIRFLIVGGTNTVGTAAIVVLLSFVLPGWQAFTIAFAIGLAYSVFLTGRWVFSSHLTMRRVALFAGAYLAIYAIGLSFVSLVSAWNGEPWLNGVSVVFTAPLSFIAGRYIFTNPRVRQVHQA